MITTGNEDLLHVAGISTIQGEHSVDASGQSAKPDVTTVRMAEWQAAVLDAQLDKLPSNALRQKASAIMSGLWTCLASFCRRKTRGHRLSGYLFQFQWKGQCKPR